MSPVALLLLGLQACLIQITYSQCTSLTPAFGGVGPQNGMLRGYGYANMLGFGNILGFNLCGLGYSGFAPTLDQIFTPTFTPKFAPGTIAGSHGGIGNGLIRVAGELPITGTTFVEGKVPIIGAVQFSGNMPAVGRVIITGNCGCGCSSRGPYFY